MAEPLLSQLERTFKDVAFRLRGEAERAERMQRLAEEIDRLPEAESAVEGLLHRDPDLRPQFARLLSHLSTPAVLPRLAALAEHPDPSVREAARGVLDTIRRERAPTVLARAMGRGAAVIVPALRWLGQDERAYPQVLRALGMTGDVHLAAADILRALWQDPERMKRLVIANLDPALQPDPDIRKSAVSQLASFPPEEGERLALERFRTDPSPGIRSETLTMLASLHAMAPFPDIADLALLDEAPPPKQAALLKGLGLDPSRESVERAMRQARRALRRYAMEEGTWTKALARFFEARGTTPPEQVRLRTKFRAITQEATGIFSSGL